MEEMDNHGEGEQDRGIGKVLLDIVKFIGFLVLALIPLQIVSMLISMQDQFSIIVNSVLGIICFIVIILIIYALWNRYYTYSKERIKRIGWRDIGIALLFFLAARFVAVVGTFLITFIYGEEMTANDEALMSMDYSSFFVLYFVLFALTIGILGPIAEELTYRGIGKHLLFKKNRYWFPLIVTSAIFGLMHTPTNIISFLLYGSMGVIFFLAYQRRKNILDSMLVHIFNNIVSTIVLVVSYIMEWL